MRRILVGLLLGIGLMAPLTEAVRIPKPPTLTAPITESEIAQLNNALASLWQLTNGRYTVEVATTNPDGSRVGTQGDQVYYNQAGSYKLCVNTTMTTATSPTGTTWRCDASALTAP